VSAELDRASAILDAGGVVAVPTDTVYGLAARLDRPDAISAVFELKGRPQGLALPVLVGEEDQLDEVVSRWPPAAHLLAARFWPGPLTLVVPAPPAVGRLVGGEGATVGVRHPRHPVIEGLLRLSGPLAVTSANLHGQQPCTSAAEVTRVFGAGVVAAVLDGGPCDGEPSTVVDLAAGPPRCLRAGAIGFKAILAALDGGPA
jgi:L-threonylcarbamoyladenylate synthase